MAKLFVLDDDHICCSVLARLLTREGHEVEWFTTGRDALVCGETKEPNLLICDWILKNGMDGVEVARTLWGRWPGLRIIFITGLSAESLYRETHELPVIQVFEKPLPLDELLAVVGKSVGAGDSQGADRN